MPDPVSSETDLAQPEGPSTSKEAQESPAPRQPSRSVITNQEKQIDDLKHEKSELNQTLENLRSKLDDLQKERNGLAIENSRLNTAQTYSQVLLFAAAIAMTIGSALISSDAEKGWMFGLGWGILAMGAGLNSIVILLGFFRR